MRKVRLTFLWELRFFGLTRDNIDEVYEQVYVLIRRLKFSYSDAYTLPIYKRVWFIKKYIEEKKQENNYVQKNEKNNKKSFR
jgi:hypothetical protein